MIRSLCVFCGSKEGVDPIYRAAAVDLGARIAREGRTLVYGGGGIGLMGAVADAALAEGGRVIGVIPEGLAKREVRHPNVPEMRVVSGMHERKALFSDLSEAFVTLPGGLGTFEEFFEVLSWGQLGIHSKPIAILNTAGYFDPLLGLIEAAIARGFVSPRHRRLWQVAEDPASLLAALDAFPSRTTEPLLRPDQK